MRLTKRILKAMTGPKDQFQLARECGNHYRVQDVFSILMNLENEGVVFQAGGLWQKVVVPPGAIQAWPRPAANSIFALAEAA